MEQMEMTKAHGKPFTIAIEMRANNDDCQCALCQARREAFDEFMNRTRKKVV